MKYEEILGEIVAEIKWKGFDAKGCSAREILYFNKKANGKLPAAYLLFLKLMGNGAGRFMAGSSCFLDELDNLQNYAEELLKENNFKSLPENSFVFWMHGGYQFAFFKLDEGDDPPVYYFSESSKKPQTDFIRKHDHLSDFYSQELEAMKIPNH